MEGVETVQRERLFKEELNFEKIAALEAAVERVVKIEERKLNKRHSNKPFHPAEHTLDSEIGVRTFAERNSARMNECFQNTLPETYRKISTAAVRGMITGHDSVINIKGIVWKEGEFNYGAVDRLRGFASGKNEYESYRDHTNLVATEMLQEFKGYHSAYEALTDKGGDYYSPEFVLYDKIAMIVAAATEPTTMFPRGATDTEFEGFDPRVKKIASAKDQRGDEVKTVLDLGNDNTPFFLESVNATESDLGISGRDPERYRKSGEAEYFELFVLVCAEYQNLSNMTKDRAAAILKQMKGWKTSQVTIPVARRTRTRKHFSYEVVRNQLAAIVPEDQIDDSEVSNYCQLMLEDHNKHEESARLAADDYDQFSSEFDDVIDDWDGSQEKLDQVGEDQMMKALELMYTDVDSLRRYVEDDVIASRVPGYEKLIEIMKAT